MKKALILGTTASFFFAFTFVLNRSMNLGGDFFLWGAALRYFFTLIILSVVLVRGDRVRPVIAAIREAPAKWILWSCVGFGVFYSTITAASVYAESWFTAAAWQFTIVAGVLLTPLFGKKIPVKNLLCSTVILVGIFVMQVSHLGGKFDGGFYTAVLMIAIGAFAYPLGNRKMMEITEGRLTTMQRVFGMVLCSMPFWIVCAFIAFVKAGAPSGSQCLQSFMVAMFSGVVATTLFFRATDAVKANPRQLAVIEATQCGEVVFTLLLGVLVLGDAMPGPAAFLGIAIIVVGMIVNSLVA